MYKSKNVHIYACGQVGMYFKKHIYMCEFGCMNTWDVFYILRLLLGVAHPPIGADTLVWPAPSGMYSYSSGWHSTMESIKFPVSARCCLLSDYHSKSCLRGVLRPRPPIYLGTFSQASWKIINISMQLIYIWNGFRPWISGTTWRGFVRGEKVIDKSVAWCWQTYSIRSRLHHGYGT